MKVLTVVGARPEFIQVAPVTRAIRRRHTETLVHTGQHYDDNMSSVFFRELALPAPEHFLGIGSGGHGVQTGQMLQRLEPVLVDEKPDWVLVLGDTNSTVAGALAAAKLHIRLAHVEAGLRSYDRTMPEEINRVITDHVSDLLLAPTGVAVQNLAKEGIATGVELVGDVRVDVMAGAVVRSRDRRKSLLQRAGVKEGEPFALCTIHRPGNTDDPGRLRAIARALGELGITVVIPIHPRLAKKLAAFDVGLHDRVHTLAPLGFLDLVALLDACDVVLTDSGGLQKEAYLCSRPCVTVRETTEWIETVEAGWNSLCEPDVGALRGAVDRARTSKPSAHPDLYGSPGVSERIVDRMEAYLGHPPHERR